MPPTHLFENNFSGEKSKENLIVNIQLRWGRRYGQKTLRRSLSLTAFTHEVRERDDLINYLINKKEDLKMNEVIVVNIGMKKIEGYVYYNIMRPHILGNPFKMVSESQRDEVIEKYRQYLWAEMNRNSEIGKMVYTMAASKKNIALACCCKPKACHGDVIKKAIEWIRKTKGGLHE